MVFRDEVFGEVIRVKSGCDAVAPMMGLVPFWEDTLEGLFALSLSLSVSVFLRQLRTQEDSSLLTSKRALTELDHADTLILDFQSSKLREINVFLLIRHTV